jgi:universal stress protein E
MAVNPMRRILVAIKDPAVKASPTLTKSAQLARAFNAELELFHDIDLPMYPDVYAYGDRQIGDDEQSIRANYLQALDTMAAPLRRSGLRASVAAEWDFPPYEAILRQANRSRTDLIVTAVHASAHHALWPLHPTDWELLRLSPMPVLLLKSWRAYREPVVLAALDPTHARAKPADLDRLVLQLGADFSRALGGSLHAVHACGASPAAMLSALARGPGSAQRLKARAGSTRAAATETLRLLPGLALPQSRLHVIDRLPVDAIAGTARELGAAIVVMGAVSRTGLKRLIIGNTAERVIDDLGCDILVVKPEGFGIRFPRRTRGAHLRVITPPILY